MIVPGDVEDGYINFALDEDDLLATTGALSWIANGSRTGELDRQFDHLVGIDRAACEEFLGRMRTLQSSWTNPSSGRHATWAEARLLL